LSRSSHPNGTDLAKDLCPFGSNADGSLSPDT
jgi:hypothetical protein